VPIQIAEIIISLIGVAAFVISAVLHLRALQQRTRRASADSQ